MDFINTILLNASWPDGFWAGLIANFFNIIKDYGLTLIIFTICLKLVLVPLDFWQKKTSRDTAKKQAKIQPKLAKLQAKYKNNKEMLNQKTMELNKAEGFNVLTSCLGMLVNLVLTLVIFITLFGAMRDIAAHKMAYQYDALAETYAEIIADGGTVEAAEDAVIVEYDNIKESFLWVNNIWKADTNTSIIPTYKEYKTAVADTEVSEVDYNKVMKPISDVNEGWNGLFVLVILAGLVTFVSQKIMMKDQNKQKQQTPKREGEPEVAAPNLNFMTYLLPGLMIIFTWSYSAAFALYIVTNSVFTMASTPIINKVLDSIDKRKEEKEKIEISYSRDI